MSKSRSNGLRSYKICLTVQANKPNSLMVMVWLILQNAMEGIEPSFPAEVRKMFEILYKSVMNIKLLTTQQSTQKKTEVMADIT